MEFMKRFVRDEDGVTMIEYALLGALISIAALATLKLIGPALDALFVKVNNALK